MSRELGRRRRDDGIERVTETTEDDPEVIAYREAHAAEFARLVRTGKPFNNDTITKTIGKVPKAAHPNLAGALFNGALRRAGDSVEIVGHTQAENTKSNASDVRLYKGVGVAAETARIETSSGRVITRTPRSVPGAAFPATDPPSRPKRTRGASSTGSRYTPEQIARMERTRDRMAAERAAAANAT
jgi:hypothetical protein